MVIRRAERGDLSAVFGLFCAVFPDGDSGFNATYFEKKFWQPENTLVAFDGRTLAAMLQFWPVESRLGACNYIYGVATRPEYRGLGLASRLLEQVPLPHVLICESAEVFSFYKKLDYDESFFVKKCRGSGGGAPDIRPLRGEDIPRAVEIYSQQDAFLARKAEDFRRMLEFYPGLSLWRNGEMIAYKIGPLEALGQDAHLFSGSFLCPPEAPFSGEILPFGCSKGLSLEKKEYINLLFN